MASMQSDTESNVSGFIRYNERNCKNLYTSLIENMQSINQDILQIEKNMTNIIKQSGPIEGQLSALLHSFPKHEMNLPMDTDQSA